MLYPLFLRHLLPLLEVLVCVNALIDCSFGNRNTFLSSLTDVDDLILWGSSFLILQKKQDNLTRKLFFNSKKSFCQRNFQNSIKDWSTQQLTVELIQLFLHLSSERLGIRDESELVLPALLASFCVFLRERIWEREREHGRRGKMRKKGEERDRTEIVSKLGRSSTSFEFVG